MLAVTCRRYGPPEVLKIEEVERPVPKAGEVLVRVHASSVTSGDVRMRSFADAGVFWLPMRLMFGVRRPRNPAKGMEFAGTIAAVGGGTTGFREGEAVFGMKIYGANAEFVAVREAGAIAAKPVGLTCKEAAVIPFGASSALAFLRDFVKIKPGNRILINGASGAVGVFAVQLAKYFGAHVTGVCSTANLELVTSLGADQVIDYSKTDFTKGDAIYDAILDTVGGTSFSRSKRVLAPNGRHVFAALGMTQLLQALWTSMRRGKRVVVGFSGGNSKDDLLLIKRLVESHRVRPIIDRVYRLDEIVEAHRYVDTGRKRGGVVVSVGAVSGSG